MLSFCSKSLCCIDGNEQFHASSLEYVTNKFTMSGFCLFNLHNPFFLQQSLCLMTAKNFKQPQVCHTDTQHTTHTHTHMQKDTCTQLGTCWMCVLYLSTTHP